MSAVTVQKSSAVAAQSSSVALAEPKFYDALFNETKWASWLWLVVRLYLGWDWLTAGYGKLTNPAWMSGAAIKGFWMGAISVVPPAKAPAAAFDWYRAFLGMLINSNAQTWFGPLVAVAEVLIGVALILGLFTWFAAFAGGFMNWNFVMAGTASVNGVFIVLSILLIMAWKIAGYWGLDRWALKLVGTPWGPGSIFTKK